MIADLVGLMEDHSGIGAICGDRIYPLVLPQKPELPAITYQTISAVRSYHMQGEDGLPAYRVQIDAWASTMADADALGVQVRDCLSGFKGDADGTEMRGIFFDTERSFYESEPKLYRVSQDFIVWYRD